MNPSWTFAALSILGMLAGFLLLNVLHFRLFRVRVVLYATLFDAVVACGGFVALYAVAGVRAFPQPPSFVGVCVLAALLACVLYAFVFPAIFDRSLSLYLLSKVDERGGRVTVAELGVLSSVDYVREMRVVEQRIEEQVASGTITVEGDAVRLTARGRRVLRVSSLFRAWLLPATRAGSGNEGRA